MALRMFTLNFCVPGTLAGNHVFNVKLPCDAQLIAVSLGNESANAGTLKIGNADDDDGYLTAASFGVSGAPAEVKTRAGFAGALAGGQFPHIAAGTPVRVTITDHAAHMIAACVMLTFTEG